MKKNLNKEFWSARYQTNQAKWNAGAVTTPIKEFVDQLTDKSIRILIPGVGHGHELVYLYEQGFSNVYAIDLASEPLEEIMRKIPSFPRTHLVQGDFFELEATFDLILEQTFFCALSPNLREAYAEKMNSLLKDDGLLAGVLFDFPLDQEWPPYGGSLEEYQEVFSKHMKVKKIERAYNSIKPRAGRELFILIEKKND